MRIFRQQNGMLRNLFRKMFPDQTEGTATKFVGEDHLGNRYFEEPMKPGSAYRYPKRFFNPATPDIDPTDANIPAEWMAWIRRTRRDPPTLEEMQRNLQAIKIKQEYAAKERLSDKGHPSEQFYPKLDASIKVDPGVSFPVRPEFEMEPGTADKYRADIFERTNPSKLRDEKEKAEQQKQAKQGSKASEEAKETPKKGRKKKAKTDN